MISLSLAAIALIIPTVFHRAADRAPGGWSPLVEQKLSLGIAVVMFMTYFCMLAFSLRTHKDLFRGAEEREATERQWSRRKAVIILLIATAFVALLSEFLVGTIESVRDSVGLTEVFVGVIVVATVGNAAEHSTAILMAMKNKMDLSFGIAISSSLQIALFVAPVLIFLSYAFGRPMDLEFTLPEVVAVVVSVYILFQISSDGETNWIEGIQLLSLYLILGILFSIFPSRHTPHPRLRAISRTTFNRQALQGRALGGEIEFAMSGGFESRNQRSDQLTCEEQAFDEEARTDVRSTRRECLRQCTRRVRRREARAQT